jgi:hypothetical protein
MESEELIKKIIVQVLFDRQTDKLPQVWQDKVNKASREVYLGVIKPLKMINSLLIDSQERLKEENSHLQNDKSMLLNQVHQLKSQGGNDLNQENDHEH